MMKDYVRLQFMYFLIMYEELKFLMLDLLFRNM